MRGTFDEIPSPFRGNGINRENKEKGVGEGMVGAPFPLGIICAP